jgi:hypothetical protein
VESNGSSSAMKEQYMAVVAAFPRVNSYATNVVGPRVREFVFGGYSGVGLSAGRFYTMGAFLDGDAIRCPPILLRRQGTRRCLLSGWYGCHSGRWSRSSAFGGSTSRTATGCACRPRVS